MSDNSSSSGMTAIVAIIAIVVIIGVGYFVAQNYMGQNNGPAINVELPTGQNNQ